MRADGSGEGRLSPQPEGDDVRRTPAQAFFQVEPAWSPDGEQIAFASRRDGRSHIYVMSADGSGTRQLTSGKHDDTAPAWSPDGKWIAFARDGRLYLMSPAGKQAPPRHDDVRRRGAGAGVVAGRQVDRAGAPAAGLHDPRDLAGAARRKRSSAADTARRRELRAGVVARRQAHRLLEQRQRRPVPDLRDRLGRQRLEAADVPARRVLRPLVVGGREDADVRARRRRLHARCSVARRTPSRTGRTTAARRGARSFPLSS